MKRKAKQSKIKDISYTIRGPSIDGMVLVPNGFCGTLKI